MIRERINAELKGHRKTLREYEGGFWPDDAFDAMHRIFVLDSNVKTVRTMSVHDDEASMTKIGKGRYRFSYADWTNDRYFVLELSDVRELRKLVGKFCFRHDVRFERRA